MERRPEPGPASGASEGPALTVPRVAPGACVPCRLDGWSEGRHAREDRAGRGVEAPLGGTPPGAREGTVGSGDGELSQQLACRPQL